VTVGSAYRRWTEKAANAARNIWNNTASANEKNPVNPKAASATATVHDGQEA